MKRERGQLAVLEALTGARGGMTVSELVEAIGITRQRIHVVIAMLGDRGLVETGDRRHQITPAGRAWLKSERSRKPEPPPAPKVDGRKLRTPALSPFLRRFTST